MTVDPVWSEQAPFKKQMIATKVFVEPTQQVSLVPVPLGPVLSFPYFSLPLPPFSLGPVLGFPKPAPEVRLHERSGLLPDRGRQRPRFQVPSMSTWAPQQLVPLLTRFFFGEGKHLLKIDYRGKCTLKL